MTRVDDAVTEARASVARLGEAVRSECAAVVDGLPPVFLSSVTAAGVSVTLRYDHWSKHSLALAMPDGHGWVAGYCGDRPINGAMESGHPTPAAALLALRATMGDRWPWGRE